MPLVARGFCLCASDCESDFVFVSFARDKMS